MRRWRAFALLLWLAGCTPFERGGGARMEGPAADLPGPASELLMEARTLDARGERAQAHRLLERAQRLAPHSPDVYLALAKHYQSQGQCESARGVAVRGLNLPGVSARTGRLLEDVVSRCR